MHIPDGYLSPSTCAVAYAAAAPFWAAALHRVKRLLTTQLVPLLAVVSAFSFVIMMFNLPLPGGTTGHAVGMGVAAIVLGPWPAILAISIALFIQALFFGDGGITSFGANCLNMAIVGSLSAYWLYRLLAGNAALDSTRRVVAGAVAGYVAINLAALLAGIEFGLQPALFHDATGAPLYAPYPLHIAVPAMLIGHLSFAGLAEAVITGGVVAYLQKANPQLLRPSAPGLGPAGRAAAGLAGTGPAAAGGWRSTRALWLGVALLMILSPLGLIAAGTAWGEWGIEDFQDATARQAIAQASADVAAPAVPPQGLARLSSIWTAPIPGYAPSFMHSETFGYILSAVVGGGLILLVVLLLSRLVAWGAPRQQRAP